MMRRVLFWRQSQQWLVVLLAAVFASPAFCQVDASTMLTVKGSRAYLFTEPEGRSHVVAELEPGEKLVPLVNVIGSGESWYMVKTQKGTVGWVKASDVQGTDQPEKTFKEEFDSTPTPEIQSGQRRTPKRRPPPEGCMEACLRAVYGRLLNYPGREVHTREDGTAILCTKITVLGIPRDRAREGLCRLLLPAGLSKECMTYYECSNGE